MTVHEAEFFFELTDFILVGLIVDAAFGQDEIIDGHNVDAMTLIDAPLLFVAFASIADKRKRLFVLLSGFDDGT